MPDRDDDALDPRSIGWDWRTADAEARQAALNARLDAITAQLDTLRLELIEVRQQLAIAINAGQVALRDLVLRGELYKRTGEIVLRPAPPD